MASSQPDRRGNAWELGIQGDYDAALAVLQELIGENPTDIVSLRMKGNLLELKELERLENSAKKLTSSADYLAARQCYERILEIDPGNVRTRIDLGDHYQNLGAIDRALEYYKDAATCLQDTANRSTFKEDVQELLERASRLSSNTRHESEVKRLVAQCQQMLDSGA